MKNVNKYVKATSLFWIITSFIVSCLITSASDVDGVRAIFGFLACFAIISFPVGLYFVGLYLWGDGYIKRFFTLFIILTHRIFKSIYSYLYNVNWYQEKDLSKCSENFLINLFKGNVRLVFTYWIFFKGIGTINSLIIEFYNFKNELLGMIFYVFAILYFFFSVIATWRSANKYDGLNKWGGVAKFIVILSVLSSFTIAVQEYQDQKNEVIRTELKKYGATEQEIRDIISKFKKNKKDRYKDLWEEKSFRSIVLRYVVSNTNKDLPQKIDEVTYLIKVESDEDRSFDYKFRTEFSYDEGKKIFDKSKDILYQDRKKYWCHDNRADEYRKMKSIITYDYFSKDMRSLGFYQIDIKKDCD